MNRRWKTCSSSGGRACSRCLLAGDGLSWVVVALLPPALDQHADGKTWRKWSAAILDDHSPSPSALSFHVIPGCRVEKCGSRVTLPSGHSRQWGKHRALLEGHTALRKPVWGEQCFENCPESAGIADTQRKTWALVPERRQRTNSRKHPLQTLWAIHTNMYKTDDQQELAVWHRELYSVFYNSLREKRMLKK